MENREHYIDDRGIALHIKLDLPDHTGKLPLLILFHGFTGSMEELTILAVKDAALRAGFAVLRAELYGHGKSGGTFHDHTILKWVQNAEAVCEYAKQLPFVHSVFLAGHSQGGLLAVLLGEKHPQDYAGFLLVSPGASIPEELRSGTLLGEAFDPDHIPESLPTWENLTLSGEYIRTMRDIDPYAAARKYPGPVQILHGSEDEIIPVGSACRLAEEFPDAKLRIIEGDNHNYDYHRDVMAKAAETALNELRQKAG